MRGRPSGRRAFGTAWGVHNLTCSARAKGEEGAIWCSWSKRALGRWCLMLFLSKSRAAGHPWSPTSWPLEEAELLFRKRDGFSQRVRSSRSCSLPSQSEDVFQRSQFCRALRPGQGARFVFSSSPPPQPKEVREDSQVLLPGCLSPAEELFSNDLLGFYWHNFLWKKTRSLFKSFHQSLKLSAVYTQDGH